MRPIWKGAITFGLISIPVRLYSAVESKSLKFHLLHEEDGGRIRYKRVCSKCGKEVTWDDIVKGYEYSKDHYVRFSEEELEALDVDSIRAIDVVTFVPLEDIDPIYYDKAYYVAPEASGLKAYKLLADALEAEGQVGVAKVALREKEHLATVRLKDDVFVLETMHWPDEIRAASLADFDIDEVPEPRKQEVQMAEALIENLTEEFDPTQYTDEYRNRVLEAVKQKVEGQEITIMQEGEEPAAVVDLMEALRQSVEAAKSRSGTGDSDGEADEESERPKRKRAASKKAS